MALSNHGRQIMEAARGAYAPSAADRVRNRRSLALRVATATAATASVSWWSSIASALGSKAGIFGVVACLGLGAAGSVSYWQLRSAPRTPRAAMASASVASADVRHAEPLVLPEVAAPTPSAPAAEARSALLPANTARATKIKPAPPLESGPDVEGEIALLSQAQRALSAGEPKRALQFLDEHARRFPRGTLTEERVAARIIALCKLGHVTRARSEGAAFLRRLPDSPLSERVRAACGDAVTQAPAEP